KPECRISGAFSRVLDQVFSGKAIEQVPLDSQFSLLGKFVREKNLQKDYLPWEIVSSEIDSVIADLEWLRTQVPLVIQKNGKKLNEVLKNVDPSEYRKFLKDKKTSSQVKLNGEDVLLVVQKGIQNKIDEIKKIKKSKKIRLARYNELM